AAEEGGPSFFVDRQTGVPIASDRSQMRPLPLVWIGVVMAVLFATGVALMSLIGAHEGETGVPRVVSTNPAPGAVVAPGPLKLSVTFDRPMHAQSYSFVQRNPATYPNCSHSAPLQSQDGRTYTLSCTVEPTR